MTSLLNFLFAHSLAFAYLNRPNAFLLSQKTKLIKRHIYYSAAKRRQR